MLPRLLAVVLLLSAVVADAQGVDPHLLAGARAFRAQQYTTALEEFRIVERAGGTADLALYLGPTLYKLGRIDEARLVLARAHRAGTADAVSNYYLGLCWYRLGLVRVARQLFVTLDPREAGPKLADGAARFVAEIDARPMAAAAPLVVTSEALATRNPIAALDAAEEAWLRAPAASAEHGRAAALIRRLAPVAGNDAIATQALSEPALP
jgi:tetratricopeptide (TPR) repeat protein